MLNNKTNFIIIFVLVTILTIPVFIMLLILIGSITLALKQPKEQEKHSPFECGFIPWENSRQTFSIQFFLIALIFLIFDVELILIFPYIITAMHCIPLISLLSLSVFLLVLTAGFVFEWLTNQLSWYSLNRS